MTLWQDSILLAKIAWPGVLSISVGTSLSTGRLAPQVLTRHFWRPDLRRPVFVKVGTHASVPNEGSHHTTELRAVRKHANPSRASQPGRRPAVPQRVRGREGVANTPRAWSLQGDVATFPQALDRERMSLTLCRREAAGERVPSPSHLRARGREREPRTLRGHATGRASGYNQASLCTRPREVGVYVALRARGRERISPPPVCGREAERGRGGHSAGMGPAGLVMPPNVPGDEAEGGGDVTLRAQGRERVSPSLCRQEFGRGLCRLSAGTRPGEGDVQVPLTGTSREEGFHTRRGVVGTTLPPGHRHAPFPMQFPDGAQQIERLHRREAAAALRGGWTVGRWANPTISACGVPQRPVGHWRQKHLPPPLLRNRVV